MLAPLLRRGESRRSPDSFRLLRHQLDDELLADVERDVRTRRQRGDAALEGAAVALQPGRHRVAAALLERVLDRLAQRLARADAHAVARAQLRRGDVAAAAVDRDVAMRDQLARAAAAGREA